MSEEPLSYREPAGHPPPAAFDFERDSRRMHARTRWARRAWRLFSVVVALVAAGLAIFGLDPEIAPALGWLCLGVAAVAGYGVAVAANMGDNRTSLLTSDGLAAIAAARVWAVTSPENGMVIFTDELLFLERSDYFDYRIPLHVIDGLELDASARTLHVTWKVRSAAPADSVGILMSYEALIPLPELTARERDEAREQLEWLRERTSARREVVASRG